jgi:hypothetical protein
MKLSFGLLFVALSTSPVNVTGFHANHFVLSNHKVAYTTTQMDMVSASVPSTGTSTTHSDENQV